SPYEQAPMFEDRTTHFVATGDATADLSCGGARIRITLLQLDDQQLTVHIRGLNCFVKKNGGRPTMATQLSQPGSIELLEKNQRVLGRFDLLYGTVSLDHNLFPIGNRCVALGTRDCTQVIALDFGAGSDLFFVYTPGKSDRSSRRTEEIRSQ